MGYYVGLDVSLKRTAICVLDADGRVVWRGSSDTHPGMIGEALDRWRGSLERVGLETGSTTPWLARGLKALGLPVVVMDARRAAEATPDRQTAEIQICIAILNRTSALGRAEIEAWLNVGR